MFKRLVLITAIALVTVLGSVTLNTPQIAEASSGCNAFHGTFIRISLPAIGPITDFFDAGDTITASTSNVSGAGTHYLMVDGAIVAGPAPLGTTLSYKFPASGTYTVAHVLTGQGSTNVHWSCGATVAGCDVSVDIPDTAVVGYFNYNAVFHWAPEPGAGSDTVIEAGKTYWVDGIDETGMYRKVLLNCTWGWVEVGTVGPNYDEVWNGTPLPNHTVED